MYPDLISKEAADGIQVMGAMIGRGDLPVHLQIPTQPRPDQEVTGMKAKAGSPSGFVRFLYSKWPWLILALLVGIVVLAVTHNLGIAMLILAILMVTAMALVQT